MFARSFECHLDPSSPEPLYYAWLPTTPELHPGPPLAKSKLRKNGARGSSSDASKTPKGQNPFINNRERASSASLGSNRCVLCGGMLTAGARPRLRRARRAHTVSGNKQIHVPPLAHRGASDDSDGSGLSNEGLAAGSSKKRSSSIRGNRLAPQRSRPVFSERENTRFEDFNLRAVIGQGSFGVVLLGTKQHGLACGEVSSGDQRHPNVVFPAQHLPSAIHLHHPPPSPTRRQRPPTVQHFALKVVSKAVLKEAGVRGSAACLRPDVSLRITNWPRPTAVAATTATTAATTTTINPQVRMQRRLWTERNILVSMDHPNIGRLQVCGFLSI
jgi:hypothetical protein